jgi:hypothetical protein
MASNRFEYPCQPIGTVAALALHLRLDERYLRCLVGRLGPADYRVVGTPDKSDPRLPAKVVYEPLPDLKRLQRRINRLLLSRVQFPPYVIGGVPGRQVLDAVTVHVHARSLLGFDVARFFESTTSKHVQRVFQHVFNLPPHVAEVLVALTTVHGHLPRGAPTSSYLANLIFYADEPELVTWLQAHAGPELRYSRWIDDITITSREPLSGEVAQAVAERVRSMLRRRGLTSHRKKERVAHDTRVVTVHNIQIRGERFSASKTNRREVRHGVHRLRTVVRDRPLDAAEEHTLRSLHSKIGYFQAFHPDEMGELKQALRQVWRHHKRLTYGRT